MADDNPSEPTTEPTTELAAPETESATDDEKLGEAGMSALRKEREKASELDKQLKAATARLQEIEDAEKTELEKANESLTSAEQRAADAESRLVRLQVAHEKGLTPAQSKRLAGSTREELEADADELLELLTPAEKTPPPGGRPTRLHSGNGGDEQSVFDPDALAAQIAGRHRL